MDNLERTTLMHPPSAGVGSRDEIRDPLRFFLRLAREYGDIVQYRASIEPAYLINHPDYIAHVLQGNGRNYNKDTYLNKHMLESVVGQGLLTSENPLWREQRRLIQPAFHRHNLANFADLMVDAASNAAQRLEEPARTRRPVDISKEMMRLTLEIVTRALFGYDIRQHADAVGEAIDVMVSIGKPRHPRVREAIAALDEIVYAIIDDRRRSPADGRDDLLSMLLNARYDNGEAMSDRQVRDEVMSLLVAGHETTANTLSWTWYLLASHPEQAARLEKEVDAVLGDGTPTPATFPQLTYTDMVIKEAMRLYPSAWSISRRALDDDEIDGYFIPARSIVAMSPYVMHRHPVFWDEPERFDPERFTAERSAKLPRFAYLPFGGGARKCIGDQFALMESMVIIPMLARRYRLCLVPDHPVEEHALVTLRPRYGIMVYLEPR